MDLGDSNLSEAEDFELALGLSARMDNEPNKHTAVYPLELDMVANEVDQMRISQSEISLRARQIPEVDQSEISLRAREFPLFDQPTTAAIDDGAREPKFDDSDDQHGQDSPKRILSKRMKRMKRMKRTKNPIFSDLQSRFQKKSPANQLLVCETASTGHSVTCL